MFLDKLGRCMLCQLFAGGPAPPPPPIPASLIRGYYQPAGPLISSSQSGASSGGGPSKPSPEAEAYRAPYPHPHPHPHAHPPPPYPPYQYDCYPLAQAGYHHGYHHHHHKYPGTGAGAGAGVGVGVGVYRRYGYYPGSTQEGSPYPPPPGQMVGEPYTPPPPLVDPYPPPHHNYYSYAAPPPPPPPSCYSHSPPSRSIPFMDPSYQSCPCPMQSCPKNVHTGPLTGASKGSNQSSSSLGGGGGSGGGGAGGAGGGGVANPLPPVVLALPLEASSAGVGPPSPARGSAGMPPPPSPALATARNPPASPGPPPSSPPRPPRLKSSQLSSSPPEGGEGEADCGLPLPPTTTRVEAVYRLSSSEIELEPKRLLSEETEPESRCLLLPPEPELKRRVLPFEETQTLLSGETDDEKEKEKESKARLSTEAAEKERCSAPSAEKKRRGSCQSRPETKRRLHSETGDKRRLSSEADSERRLSSEADAVLPCAKRKRSNSWAAAKCGAPEAPTRAANKRKSGARPEATTEKKRLIADKKTERKPAPEERPRKNAPAVEDKKKAKKPKLQIKPNGVRSKKECPPKTVKGAKVEAPVPKPNGVTCKKAAVREAEPLPEVELVANPGLKWSNGWSWEGEPFKAKVFLTSDDALVVRRCYPAMRHIEGDVIYPRDCVLLKSGTRKQQLPFVAKVAAMWENPEDGEMMVSLLWYYRPEHTEQGRLSGQPPDEIFASRHKDTNSVACIEDKCFVLTFNEYCRHRKRVRCLEEGGVRRPNSVVPQLDVTYPRLPRQPPDQISPDIVFFCRKVYDFRQRRILKNPC